MTDRDRSAQIVAAGVAVGDTRLRPGTPLAITAPALETCRSAGRPGTSLTDGEVVVTTCTHRIDAAHGFVSRFSTEPFDAPPEAPGTVSSLGIVADVADPTGAARCASSWRHTTGSSAIGCR